MKTLIYTLFILIFSFSIYSCSNEEDDDMIGLDTSPNTFVANFEGNAWEASVKEAILTENYLTVYGQAGDGSVISLQMKLYTQQPVDKAYILANDASHYAIYDQTGPLDSLIYWTKNNFDDMGQSGDIVLTKLDKGNRLVSGTFKFRAFNNHDAQDYYYFSQGAFTDVQIVDSLSIITGINVSPGDLNNDDNNNNNTPDPDYVNCTVNGSTKESTSATIASQLGYLVIQGTYSGTETISMQFPGDATEGTYDVANSANDISMSYESGSVSYSAYPTGSFSISSRTDERISGVFNVTLKNPSDTTQSVTIESGVYSISLMQ